MNSNENKKKKTTLRVETDVGPNSGNGGCCRPVKELFSLFLLLYKISCTIPHITRTQFV